MLIFVEYESAQGASLGSWPTWALLGVLVLLGRVALAPR